MRYLNVCTAVSDFTTDTHIVSLTRGSLFFTDMRKNNPPFGVIRYTRRMLNYFGRHSWWQPAGRTVSHWYSVRLSLCIAVIHSSWVSDRFYENTAVAPKAVGWEQNWLMRTNIFACIYNHDEQQEQPLYGGTEALSISFDRHRRSGHHMARAKGPCHPGWESSHNRDAPSTKPYQSRRSGTFIRCHLT